jgi:uncharacterized protein YllA (UPF0747 family)
MDNRNPMAQEVLNMLEGATEEMVRNCMFTAARELRRLALEPCKKEIEETLARSPEELIPIVVADRAMQAACVNVLVELMCAQHHTDDWQEIKRRIATEYASQMNELARLASVGFLSSSDAAN